jgi:hypothetical protein
MTPEQITPQFSSPVLTEAEVIVWLRLDIDGPRNPRSTLKFYRQKGLLRAVRIGRQWRYTLSELHAFLDRLTQKSARRAEATIDG